MTAPLSTIAQGFGVLGVLLVPVGALWLIAELGQRSRPIKGRGFVFAVITVIIGTLIAAALMLAGLGTVGPSLAMFVLAAWLYSLSKLIPWLRAMRHSDRDRFNPTPLYLVIIPVAALILQIAAAAPLTAASRAPRHRQQRGDDREHRGLPRGAGPLSEFAARGVERLLSACGWG
jgi:hypothetical protein